MECQPAWRRGKGWPPLKEQTGDDWGKLSASRKNGLFLVVMSMSWWATSLETTDDRHSFKEAVDDVRWVIEQQLQSHTAPDVPPVDKDGLNIPDRDSVTVPNYLHREEGKRQVKPMCWLMDHIAATTLTG